jgi:hypothetical protein
VARLEAQEAAQFCAQAASILTQTMNKTTNPFDLPYLAQGLLAVAARLEPKEAAQAAAALIQAVTKTTDRTTLQTLAQSLAAVLAREPPAQALVDLLKHPCCVGEARRLVLEALSRHYQRSFADQWDFVDFAHQHKLGLDLTTPLTHVP